ncbi:MAG: hypothetical protein CEN91_371 [Candidatus Berkelbacteria bacterium Licking1014_85]|uniref:Uncharacterized protein n=1 Tax=Candidatus Berkelbacteria bacterium Licking1014_85 TaxID=2017148 RepID=A0A554LIQ5_9BACT|nr:MAG: hypothetical protein CEN91_371 [Candidatus Berkelbacteria bacterium Licking1014_85]
MKQIRRGANLIIRILFIIGIIFPFNIYRAQAASLTGGSASLSTPAISATSVSYTLDFDNVTTSATKCLNIRFTATIGSNSLPTGMGTSSTAFGGTSDYIPTPGSWSVDNTGSANGIVKLTLVGGETPISATDRTIVLTGITNGSTKNTTYYAELSTFGNTDCATSALDTGVVTFAFTEGVTVSATVNPTLTYTVDSTTCALGTLSASAIGSCSHTMTAATNGTGGYAVSYIAGNTLTSGASDTITAIGGTAATSSIGNEQFGINLKDNATPNVGANPSGGSGAAMTNYDTADNFAYNTAGASIANVAGPSATTTFTVSMIANIAAQTEAGAYSTTVTYNITSNY